MSVSEWGNQKEWKDLPDTIRHTQRTIIVHMTGGLVDQVDNLPPGYQLEIRDYETGSYPEDRIIEDERGTRYYSYIYPE